MTKEFFHDMIIFNIISYFVIHQVIIIFENNFSIF